MLEFNGKKLSLKYLYVAVFEDGTCYEQNESDVSVNDPTRSCFFDIQTLLETKTLASFAITDGVKTWSLNFQTGQFALYSSPDDPGMVFKLHDEGAAFFNKRLIFFRRRSHNLNTGDETGCIYVFGWQGNVAQSPESPCEKFTIFVT